MLGGSINRYSWLYLVVSSVALLVAPLVAPLVALVLAPLVALLVAIGGFINGS